MERKKMVLTQSWNCNYLFDLYEFYCEDCNYKFSIRANEDNSRYVFYEPTEEDKKEDRHTLVECPKCGKILSTNCYYFCEVNLAYGGI